MSSLIQHLPGLWCSWLQVKGSKLQSSGVTPLLKTVHPAPQLLSHFTLASPHGHFISLFDAYTFCEKKKIIRETKLKNNKRCNFIFVNNSFCKSNKNGGKQILSLGIILA